MAITYTVLPNTSCYNSVGILYVAIRERKNLLFVIASLINKLSVYKGIIQPCGFKGAWK